MLRTCHSPDVQVILSKKSTSRTDTALHALTAPPDITPADRLGVTVFFSVLAHLIVILGVTFASEALPERRVETLDVVLVPPRPAERPDQADALAQANQDGGGLGDRKARSAAPPPAPAARTASAGDDTILGDLTRSDASNPTHDVGTDQPMRRSQAIAARSAEIDRRLDSYPRHPRRKWISARTREHKFATYMDAWRRKVERIGNLNYPDEATRLGLSGNLLLDVALNPDGTVEDVVLRRSSGHRVLDEAAIRIVKLASPFAKFPDSVAREVDVLHIVRTWAFHSGNRFSSP